MPNPELSEVSGFLDGIGAWEGFEVAHVTMEDALEPDALGVPACRRTSSPASRSRRTSYAPR